MVLTTSWFSIVRVDVLAGIPIIDLFGEQVGIDEGGVGGSYRPQRVSRDESQGRGAESSHRRRILPVGSCLLPAAWLFCLPFSLLSFLLEHQVVWGRENQLHNCVHWQAHSNFKKCVTLQAARPLIRQLLYDVV